ncbi:MAG: hypothetical protein AAF533_14960 [Acidobacteriota bacterium]
MSERVHRAWRWIAAGALTLLLVSNLCWAYVTIDQAVTIGYMTRGHEDSEHALKASCRLVIELMEGRTRRDLVVLARRVAPEDLVVDDEEGVSVAGLTFELADDRIIGVRKWGGPFLSRTDLAGTPAEPSDNGGTRP